MTGVSSDRLKTVVSYSHVAQDSQAAKALVDELRAKLRCDVFIDREMPSGVSWEESIDLEIQDADCVIALVSRASLASERCREEWRNAKEHLRQRGRPQILPLRIDDSTDIPQTLAGIQIDHWRPVTDAGAGQRTVLRKAVEEANRKRREHDFWGDAFFERELQLAVANRSLSEGRWQVEDVDDVPINAEAEGVNHWLAIQDIRAAVHLTNQLARIRRRGIQVVLGKDVDLNKGDHCAIALGLGFNRLTRVLEKKFKMPLFEVKWGKSENSKFNSETDGFALPGCNPEPVTPEMDRALVARIVLPAAVGPGICTYFVCAGRTAPGTDAAGWFLANRWKELLALYAGRLSLTKDSLAGIVCHHVPNRLDSRHEPPPPRLSQFVTGRAGGLVDPGALRSGGKSRQAAPRAPAL